MASVLYSASTGEIRARAFDEAGTSLTNATLTCTLWNARSRPVAVFTARAMAYSAGHPFSDVGDLGCYFCTASAAELTGAEGVWLAVITAVDASGNTLVLNAYVDVEPFVAS